MNSTRLEAFSDAVIAIIITIMILELRAPHGSDFTALRPLLSPFFTYVMSFAYLAIYWNNHHHMLTLCERVTGSILWANMHLLFWLSMIPLVTGWMGENAFAPIPTALYGGVLLMNGMAYLILQICIIRSQRPHSILKDAVGKDTKGKLSAGLYAVAILLSFLNSYVAVSIYVTVALVWLVPDKRIETIIAARQSHDN